MRCTSVIEIASEVKVAGDVKIDHSQLHLVALQSVRINITTAEYINS